jgi:hypothetical protein
VAIKAYNAGTNNNLIDTTDKFLEGDMLVFDISKNLFVKGLSRAEIATSTEIASLKGLVDQITTFSGNYDDLTNKPTIPDINGLATEAYVDQQVATAVAGGQIDLSGYVTEQELTIAITNANYFSGDYNDLTNAPTLFDGDYNNLLNAPTLFDGDYNSLLNKPTLFSGSWNDLSDKPNLFSGNYNDLYNKPVVFSGNYNDLYNQPTIPTDISQLTDTTNLIFDRDYNNLTNKPQTLFDFGIVDGTAGQVLTTDGAGGLTFTSVSGGSGGFDGQWSSLTGTPTTLAGYGITDGFSGDYNDLTNQPILFSGLYTDLVGKPTIPTDVSDLTDNQSLLPRFSGNYNDLTNKPTLFSGSYNDLTDKPTLFDGNYNSLTNKPSIPSTLTDLGITDGTSGQVLTTDGSGGFTFTTVSGGGTTINQLSDVGDVSTTAPTTGQVLKWDGTQWAPASDSTSTGGTGIALTDLSVTTAQASGNGSLAYNDVTGVFTFTPADVQSVDLAGYATELYVQSQVFSGDYNDLTNQPTIPTDVSQLSDTTNLLSGGTASIDPWSIDSNGNFVPDTNEAYDIGSPTARVRDIYMSGNSLYFEAEALTKDTDGNLRWQGNDIRDYTQLKNKPDLSNLTSTDTNNPNRPVTYNALNTELDGYVSEAELTAALANAGIFSGDYNDLTNKPTIPGPQTLTLSGNTLSISDGNSVDLTSFAGGGSTDLTNYYTKTEVDGLLQNVDLTGYATETYVDQQVANAVSGGGIDLSNYATTSYVDQKIVEVGPHFSGNYNDLVNLPTLFSGDYNDLVNTPAGNSDLRMELVGNELQLINIEPDPDTVISTVDLATLGASIANDISYNNLSDLPSLFSGDYNDLVNRPTLFSGSYNDLSNKPFIPSIAGLASESYVDNKHAEPTIYGDKTFTGSVTFEDFTMQKTSIVSHTAAKRELVMAIQTSNAIPTEVLLPDSTRIGLDADSTAMFKATFVAVSNATSASFNIRGVINHSSSGTTQLIGTNIEEIITDGGTTWGGDVTAHDADNSVSITVTGSDATVVDWTIFVELTEVKR